MKPFLLSLLFLSVISLILLSCESPTKKNEDSVDGVYQSMGYGRVVKVEDGEFLLADTTSKSCIALMEGNISDFEDAFQYKNDTITLQDGINTYYFTRIADAPAICKKESPEYKAALAKANNPEYNFEILWETFEDHYAYWELRKVNPDSMYAEYRPRVTSETTEAELFLILNEMLDSFDDGHIGIEASDEIEDAAYALYLEAHPEKAEEESSSPDAHLRNYQVAASVAEQYIPEGTTVKNGNMRWGMLKNKTGYVQVNQMMGLADVTLSDTLSYRAYWMAYFDLIDEEGIEAPEEVVGINTTLDVIMKDLKDAEALIIDVRFNGGGKDEVGLAFLERLNQKDQVVFTKKGRMGNGFTPDNKVIQKGSTKALAIPIYMLIATESASATEIMALSSLSIPTITRIGSRTEGVFSDILDKELPNGWTFGLSSEVYLDMDGNNYEGVGIAPNIELGYARDTQKFLRQVMDDLDQKSDRGIERALAEQAKK